MLALNLIAYVVVIIDVYYHHSALNFDVDRSVSWTISVQNKNNFANSIALWYSNSSAIGEISLGLDLYFHRDFCSGANSSPPLWDYSNCNCRQMQIVGIRT